MKNKNILTAISLVVIITTLSIGVHGHGGKTDGSGGHYDRSTGEYHFHHGYSAHQHTNGECPYDFDDRTDHSSGSHSSEKTQTNNQKTNKPKSNVVEDVFLWFFISIPIVFISFFVCGGILSSFTDNDTIFKICMPFVIVLSLILSAKIVF